ncbi:hypothetical protein D3C73_1598050 [compost metagenome]
MLTVVPDADALLPGVQGKGFQATKADIQPRPITHRARKDETPDNALRGQARDFRTTRIIEPHHLRRLVEGFAGGIVQGLAQ